MAAVFASKIHTIAGIIPYDNAPPLQVPLEGYLYQCNFLYYIMSDQIQSINQCDYLNMSVPMNKIRM